MSAMGGKQTFAEVRGQPASKARALQPTGLLRPLNNVIGPPAIVPTSTLCCPSSHAPTIPQTNHTIIAPMMYGFIVTASSRRSHTLSQRGHVYAFIVRTQVAHHANVRFGSKADIRTGHKFRCPTASPLCLVNPASIRFELQPHDPGYALGKGHEVEEVEDPLFSLTRCRHLATKSCACATCALP
jgi:hypothetical protein